MTPLPRLLRRSRFALLTALMLALGVGATTALFSIVNGVLLEPLALPHPGQLVLVGERTPQIPDEQKFLFFDTPPAIAAWSRQETDFSGMAALQSSQFALANGGRPRLLRGAKVATNFFDVLEVPPQLGRLFTAADETDAARPMVITDRLWRSAFNADPAVLGRQVGVPGSTALIVGVLPAWFRLDGRELGPMLAGQTCDYFIPLHIDRAQYAAANIFSDFNYSVIARLRPGVSPAQALAQLNVIQAGLAAGSAQKLQLYGAISNLRDYAVAPSRAALWLLLAAVLAVLLIVCVNTGGLWLTRISDRRRDWAIRAALGATPARLARQVLGEALALALIGGGLGVICAVLSLRALVAAAPPNLPRLNEVHLDWRVFVFGFGLSLLAGLATGLLPAIRLCRADANASLKGAGSATTADAASLQARHVLVGVQAGLATLLLTGAALLGTSFYRMQAQPTGFNPAHAVAADISILGLSDADRARLESRLPAAAVAIPGIEAAGFTSFLPLQGETWVDSATVPGRSVRPGGALHVNVRFVSPGYFRAIGIPLLAGRDLAESDRPAGWPPATDAAEAKMSEAVVISRATARALWPDASPLDLLSRKILIDGELTPAIVGIVADTRASLTDPPPPIVYEPYWEYPPYSLSLVVRTELPLGSVAGPLRSAIAGVLPTAAVPKLRPLAGLTDAAVAPQRYQLSLLLLFAAVALALAAMGVYELASHSVTRRTRELAIRMSLGAQPGELWRLVVRQGLTPVIAGILVGLAGALAAGKLLAGMLFQVSAGNPLIFAAAALTVLAAALAGCVPPAWRATRTDPLLALRAE